MHALSLADMAATVTNLSAAMLQLRVIPNTKAGHALWTFFRSRYDEWSYRLALHRDALHHVGVSRRARKWEEVTPILQEILLSEPLIRNIACVASLLESSQVTDELASLTQSILSTQIEARHRCLHLIVFGHGMPVESAVRLNRIRQSLEQYNDQLLAILPIEEQAEEYGFNPKAIVDARTSLLNPPEALSNQWRSMHAQFLSQQLWRKLQVDIDWRSANGRLNYSIAQSILNLFPIGLFDSFGVAHQGNWFRAIKGDSLESDGRDINAVQRSPLGLLSNKPVRPNNVDVRDPKRW